MCKVERGDKIDEDGESKALCANTLVQSPRLLTGIGKEP